MSTADERQRCIQDVCHLCAGKDPSAGPATYLDPHGYVHWHDGVQGRWYVYCEATRIHERAASLEATDDGR